MGISQVSWTDELFQSKKELRIWKKVVAVLSGLILVLGVTNIWLVKYSVQELNSQRLLLVAPGFDVGPVEVPADAKISPNVMKFFAKRVVTLNEQWSYESIEDNFSDLFEYYYSKELEELTKANLLSSQRIKLIQSKKMISTFRFDWKKIKGVMVC